MGTLNRSYYAGAILWILSIQYYITQLIVANDWASNRYSWANNTISDLANTHCGLYGDRLVCSPLHTLMNGSFILLGVTQAGGALLLWKYLAANRTAKLGLSCMVVAGLGTILVGLFPENTVSALHITGAALPFIFGNLGMVILGVGLSKLPVILRGFSILAGLVGLTALASFIAQTYLGFGIGGMERFVAYPQSIWMIVVGVYLLLNSYSSRWFSR